MIKNNNFNDGKSHKNDASPELNNPLEKENKAHKATR